MIMPTNRKAKEPPAEVTVERSEVKIIGHLPGCPKCKLADDVFFFNVTSQVFECLRCNLRFRFTH